MFKYNRYNRFFFDNKQKIEFMHQQIITMPFVAFQTRQGQFTKNMFNSQNRQSVFGFVSKIKTASLKKQKNSPLIKLSVLFVPNWEIQGNSYQNQFYLQTKEKFFKQVLQFFQNKIYIQDFYLKSNLNQNQKKFFYQLGSLKHEFGNCIDIIKICKIIQNKGKKHLSLDLNTKIIDIDGLYEMTFNSSTQRDLLNACYYDQHYISAHNKIVYCPEGSPLAQKINEKFIKFIETNADNQEIKYKNCIYSNVFAEATHALQYTKKVIINNKSYFVAQLKNQVFSMTKLILSAIHRSWDPQKRDQKKTYLWSNLIVELSKTNFRLNKFLINHHQNGTFMNFQAKIYNEILNQIESTKFWCGDALIDVKVLEYIAKKHYYKLKQKTIQLLRSISDQQADKIIVKTFLEKIERLTLNIEKEQNEQENQQRYTSLFQQQKFNKQYFQTIQKNFIQLEPLQQLLKN